MFQKFQCVLALSLGILVIFGGCSVARKEIGDTRFHKVKILSYNVRNARGMDGVEDFDRVANVIRAINADCVALQELDSATQRSHGKVALEELARRTGMYASYSASIDYQGGKYGIGILTRDKPLRKKNVPLPGREEKRSLLMVEMDDYVMCCTHWSLKQPDRAASAGLIDSAVKTFSGKPIFLAGDFNAVPDSREITTLSEKWRMLTDGSLPTSPADEPRSCIDYIFALKNTDYDILVRETRVENEPLASDHRPVWVSVAWRKK